MEVLIKDFRDLNITGEPRLRDIGSPIMASIPRIGVEIEIFKLEVRMSKEQSVEV